MLEMNGFHSCVFIFDMLCFVESTHIIQGYCQTFYISCTKSKIKCFSCRPAVVFVKFSEDRC